MNSIIMNFDSTDWGSIKDTIKMINEVGSMQVGTTSEGEEIHFYVNGDGEEEEYVLVTEVFQKNGWVRRNIYYPSDCIIETLYHK